MNTALFQQEMKNIEEYTQTLCETLEENFEQDSLDSYRAMQMREGYSIYAAKRIEEIENGTATFTSLSYRKDVSILRSYNSSLMTWVLIQLMSTEMVQYMHS